MKKLLLLFALLGCIALQTRAQGTLPGGFKHIIEVGRYTDYGKGYLTITDDNAVGFEKYGDNRIYYDYYTYEYVDEYKDNEDAHFHNGHLILEVDGVSAEGWTKEDFYRKVEGRRDVITLKIRSRKEGSSFYEFETKIRPLYVLPDNVKVFGNVFATVAGRRTADRRKNGGLTSDTSFEELSDEDFDFFNCRTFDYLITSNDPLLDKAIFKELSTWNWQRDEKNPDILFTIARDANESISTTYVPPSSRVVNEGSKTTARYNYITKQNDYITTQKNRTIYEGGYTQETRTVDIFLEIAALDVKRINDPAMTYPPIVWKATGKRHVVNPSSSFNLKKELEAYASWMAPPPEDRIITADRTVYAPVGIVFQGDTVLEVAPYSRAERAGILPGDRLLKIIKEDGHKVAKKIIKNNGWKAVEGDYGYYLSKTLNIEVLRNGQKVKLTLQPVSTHVFRYYWVGAE